MGFKEKLLIEALEIVSAKLAPLEFSRSEETYPQIDFYVATFQDATGRKFLFRRALACQVEVTEFRAQAVENLDELPEENEGEEQRLRFTYAEAVKWQLVVQRFLREYEFKHLGAWSVVWSHWSRKDERRILKSKVQRQAYRLRSLERKQRMDVLRMLVEKTTDRQDYATSVVTLMVDLYTTLVFLHPEKARIMGYTKLLLQSLVESKDLETDGLRYKVTPKALVTLTQWEEDDRRHRDSVTQQQWIKAFTLILAIAATIQAFEAARRSDYSWLTSLISWW